MARCGPPRTGEGARMFHSNRTTRTLRASVATVLCAALLTTGAMAAAPKLQTIDVTPAAKTISVGQKQTFTATGTFSNGSKQALGPAISNIAPGGEDTCALLTSGGVECWGDNGYGQLGDGNTTDSLIPRPVKGISYRHGRGHVGYHSCALLASGAVQCWGYNLYGELGNGSTSGNSDYLRYRHGDQHGHRAGLGCASQLCAAGQRRGPVLGVATRWPTGRWIQCRFKHPGICDRDQHGHRAGLGSYHSCARTGQRRGPVLGQNYDGELGNGTNTASNMPVTVSWD